MSQYFIIFLSSFVNQQVQVKIEISCLSHTVLRSAGNPEKAMGEKQEGERASVGMSLQLGIPNLCAPRPLILGSGLPRPLASLWPLFCLFGLVLETLV